MEIRSRLGPSQRLSFGRTIYERVIRSEEWIATRVLGIYLSLPSEVPTRDLIETAWKNGIRVAAPVVHPDLSGMDFRIVDNFGSLRPGPGNILQPLSGEPVPPEVLDLVLVPGVAFDLQGNRLGMGRGLFDRYLAQGVRLPWGLAFDCQILEALPVGDRDQPMRRVVTESRVLPAGV